MRFGSTAKVLLKCKLKYYRISECYRTLVVQCTPSCKWGVLTRHGRKSVLQDGGRKLQQREAGHTDEQAKVSGTGELLAVQQRGQDGDCERLGVDDDAAQACCRPLQALREKALQPSRDLWRLW